jgi:YD repeat-containing protein
VSGISDASGTGAGNDQSYLYLGLNTIVQATDGNGIALTYIKQAGDTLAGSDAGDQYVGLDRFGRVDDQNWVNTSSGVSTDRFQYGYDADGNVLYKNNLLNSSFSELYHANAASSNDDNAAYDNLNRLQGFRRGTLSASSYNGGVLDTVSTLNSNSDSSQSWTLDALGNQTSVTTDGTATGRTVNSQNQVTAVGSTSLAYDNNGNTTTDENGHTLIYDAWNRLIEVKNGSTVLASYVYDANGNRIQQTESSATTDLYQSTQGRVLEERQSGTVTNQYVWGLMYVNQLVERDDNSTSGSYGASGSGLGRRIYVQQDADWNVTALISSSGTVLERADYTPYGIQTTLSASWATTTDAYGVVYGYQGGRRDPVTGLVHFSQGNAGRDFDTYLGTAVEQDPPLGISGIRFTGQLRPNLQPHLARSQYLDPMLVALTRAGSGYISSFNRYQVEGNNPLHRVDPSGLSWLGALGGALSGGLVGGIVAGLIIVGTGGAGAVVVIGIGAALGVAGGAYVGSQYNGAAQGAVHGVTPGIVAGMAAPFAPVVCPFLVPATEEAEQEIQNAEGNPLIGQTPVTPGPHYPLDEGPHPAVLGRDGQVYVGYFHGSAAELAGGMNNVDASGEVIIGPGGTITQTRLTPIQPR